MARRSSESRSVQEKPSIAYLSSLIRPRYDRA
jgi:hypothetical protein